MNLRIQLLDTKIEKQWPNNKIMGIINYTMNMSILAFWFKHKETMTL